MQLLDTPAKTRYVTVRALANLTLRADECEDWSDEELIRYALRYGVVEEFVIDGRA